MHLSSTYECSALYALRSHDSSSSSTTTTTTQAPVTRPRHAAATTRALPQRRQQQQQQSDDEVRAAIASAVAQCERAMQCHLAAMCDALTHLDTRLMLHEACVARARQRHAALVQRTQRRTRQRHAAAKATAAAASRSDGSSVATAEQQQQAHATAMCEAVVRAIRCATDNVQTRLAADGAAAAAAARTSVLDARFALEVRAAVQQVHDYCARAYASPLHTPFCGSGCSSSGRQDCCCRCAAATQAPHHHNGDDTAAVVQLTPLPPPLVALAQQLRNVCTVLDNYTAETARAARRTAAKLQRWQRRVEALVRRACDDMCAA